MLTWNIGGRRDAGCDICHMLEQRRERQEEDVHVIVLTEVKTAHTDTMNKFRDMGYTAVGTEVANAQERKGAEQTRARGGVVTLLGEPYGRVEVLPWRAGPGPQKLAPGRKRAESSFAPGPHKNMSRPNFGQKYRHLRPLFIKPPYLISKFRACGGHFLP